MEEYWSHSSEAESSCHQFSEDSWTYNSSSPIQNSADTFDITSCMAQSNYDFQNTSYQDRFYVYNQAYYANSFSSEIEEKTEMFEDSGSEVEVRTLYKTAQEENGNCDSKSAPIKGGMKIIKFTYLIMILL